MKTIDTIVRNSKKYNFFDPKSRTGSDLAITEPIAASQYIYSLDGLRGIAVILVFLEHITGNLLPENSWMNFGNAHMGRSGVYLFFVLSSFLLTCQLLRPNNNLENLQFWLNYLSRRILRIYPLYVFVLLFYLIFPSFKFNLLDFFQHVILLAGRNHFWSIPTEVKYYLILPFIALSIVFLFKKKTRIVILYLGILILITSLLKSTIVSTFVAEPRLSIIPNLSIFLIGSLAAVLHLGILELSFERRQKLQSLMEGIAIITAVLLFFSFRTVWNQAIWRILLDSSMPSFEADHWFFDIQAGFWAVLMISHLHGQGWVSRLLRFSLLRYIGITSFGIYLWHIAVLGYLKTHLDFLSESFQVIAISVVTLLIATATYVLIEQPFMRIKFSFALQNPSR
jgi:peptidoglycan/LPS O-acetylase OafA/YrhL